MNKLNVSEESTVCSVDDERARQQKSDGNDECDARFQQARHAVDSGSGSQLQPGSEILQVPQMHWPAARANVDLSVEDAARNGVGRFAVARADCCSAALAQAEGSKHH